MIPIPCPLAASVQRYKPKIYMYIYIYYTKDTNPHIYIYTYTTPPKVYHICLEHACPSAYLCTVYIYIYTCMYLSIESSLGRRFSGVDPEGFVDGVGDHERSLPVHCVSNFMKKNLVVSNT